MRKNFGIKEIPNCYYDSVTVSLHELSRENQTPNLHPNAEESGKIWDFGSLNYNMYWLLLICILDLGQEVFIIRGTFSNRMKRFP